MSSSLNIEKGKTYIITFKSLIESLWRVGYEIEYEGWSDEEKSPWPEKNIIINPLW